MPHDDSPLTTTLYWQSGNFFSGRSPSAPIVLLGQTDRRAGSTAAIKLSSQVNGDETVPRSLQCRWLSTVPRRLRRDGLQKRIDLNDETITQTAATEPGSSG